MIGDAVNLGRPARVAEQGLWHDDHHERGPRRRLRGRYNLRALGSVTVKGKTEAVEIFEVVADIDREADSGF